MPHGVNRHIFHTSNYCSRILPYIRTCISRIRRWVSSCRMTENPSICITRTIWRRRVCASRSAKKFQLKIWVFNFFFSHFVYYRLEERNHTHANYKTDVNRTTRTCGKPWLFYTRSRSGVRTLLNCAVAYYTREYRAMSQTERFCFNIDSVEYKLLEITPKYLLRFATTS